MAPRGRGRSRKMNTRTDAALDAMRAFGFPDDLTLKKLKELLDIYGEENWFFVEENSYEVLREGILEQQEKEEEEKDPKFLLPALPAVSYSLAPPVADAATGIPSRCCHCHRHHCCCSLSFLTNSPEPVAWSSGVDIAPPCSETKALSIVLATNELVEDSTLQTYGVSDTFNSDGHFPPSGNGTESCLQIVNLDENSGRENARTACAFPHSNQPQEPKDGFPIRSRRPCHGWICSDDEFSESDLVEVEPAPSPEEFLKLLTRVRSNEQRKRKTRWDLRPEDV